MNPVSPNNRNVRGCRGFAEINAYWNFNVAGSINFDSNFLCGRVSLISSYSDTILYHLGFLMSRLPNVELKKKKLKNFINVARCQYKFAEAELQGSAGAAIMTGFFLFLFSLCESIYLQKQQHK